MNRRFETEDGIFVVRPYQPRDEAGILSLWKAAFDKEMPPDLWQWKYLKNPYPVQIAVAVGEDGMIAVMYGGIPYRANWKGDIVTITHLMDIMSHPTCRGSGLFVKTGLAFFDLFAGPERTCFYYGFPGKYHFEIGRKYLQYDELKKGVGFLKAEVRALTRNRTRFGSRIEPISKVDEAFDHLWGRCARDYPLAVVRDAPFLRWRFFEHPLCDYEVWGYRSCFRRAWTGYAAFAIQGKKARMVDFLCPPSEKIVEDLFARLGQQFDERGIREVEIWLPKDHFLTRVAVAIGFRLFPEPLGFIPTGRSFHPGLSLDWASQHLYYTMADGDLL